MKVLFRGFKESSIKVDFVSNSQIEGFAEDYTLAYMAFIYAEGSQPIVINLYHSCDEKTKAKLESLARLEAGKLAYSEAK